MPKKLRITELEEFRSEMEARKAQILGSLKLAHTDKEDLANYNEMNDVMSKNDESAGEIADIITNVEIQNSLEKTLKDIDQALALMLKGDYGVCKYCKEDISVDRLRIRPVSTSCVKCKSQFTN